MIHNVEKYLFSLETKGIKMGLSRTRELLDQCGSPQTKIPIIQVLGTNGKGSTSAILYKLLNLEYNVGLYTSPHLYSFRERIRYNGQPISVDEVAKFLSKYQKNIENLNASFFEVMTVMAIWYFVHKKADYAIMETGLGGKFDSVTACEAKCFAITPISMDHSHILGDSLELIAKEKIAAISKSSTVYSVLQKANLNALIEDCCKANKSHLFFVPPCTHINLSLKGEHQKENASLALKVANSFLTDWNQQEINRCLESINWHGRNQTLKNQPHVIFDVGHNEDGIQSFLNFIKKDLVKQYSKKTLLFSIQKNKQIHNIANELENSFDRIIYTQTSKKYSMEFNYFKQYFPSAEYIKSPHQALDNTISGADSNELIAIVGTHYWGDFVKTFFNICFDNI